MNPRQLAALRSIREHVRAATVYLDECERAALDPDGYAGEFLIAPTPRGLLRTAAAEFHNVGDRLGDLGRELP